ncbi:Polyadenylate-binding protein 2 [Monoraphidium neglectum]|uniref:Polyadenylate-binding protein 2 n=1 Tax=Monoraphidium neglectum TaxID=145388 RepID=A0A0D2M0Y1_9CHLO|nr:Polyadenylate-binding protein 2 [Monoraphidium neglectum]KIY97319.1 Polyadenylate-binding protein 2 [Monoraphidium neglectum]|eukprot:XP_013896339.1 Polyadenylate-binding protein 2 [Monoraphidium neglectum]
MTDPEQQVGAAEEDEYEGEGMEEEGAEDGEDELEDMRRKLAEMEEEAARLKEQQDKAQAPAAAAGAPAAVGAAAAAAAAVPDAEQVAKEEADGRSVYVGNVDYAATPEELQLHFQGCGTVNRVTILTDAAGNPKGFAYVEFLEADAVDNALLLDASEIRGRGLKVLRKRTNVPGLKARGRGRGRGRSGGGYFGARGGGGAFTPRGRGGYRGRGRGRGYSPY